MALKRAHERLVAEYRVRLAEALKEEEAKKATDRRAEVMDTTRDLEEAFENELELTLVVPDAESRRAYRARLLAAEHDPGRPGPSVAGAVVSYRVGHRLCLVCQRVLRLDGRQSRTP